MWQFIRFFVLSILLVQSTLTWANNGNEINYKGTLLSLPCVIDEENPIIVDFKTVIDRQLYLYGKSNAIPLTILLKDCDPTLANSVKVSINGNADNVTSDGYLMFDKNSLAKGAAIGINDSTGKQILVNSQLPVTDITAGNMAIILYAYLTVYPTSLDNNSIVPGVFSATLHYTLNFE